MAHIEPAAPARPDTSHPSQDRSAPHPGGIEVGALMRGPSSCEFVVWAPRPGRVDLRLLTPRARTVPMVRGTDGYWRAVVDDCPPGAAYVYLLNGDTPRPDPASRFQPEGVHGCSSVVDHSAFAWTDGGWTGVDPADLVVYELHTGTFSREGTFAGVIPRLEELRGLGVTAVQLMPVGQFPGARNWGYDGVHPFAVQNTYGGPDGLKTLVDACHRAGLAVFLDVVYNHLGPEGNYLAEFAPYFTDRYRTPWGQAVNFDGAWSDHVRNYFITNALSWFRDYHFDGLRLDAVHAIYDRSAAPFLAELAARVREATAPPDRPRLLIAESNLNDPRIIRPPAAGGFGLDGQWNDDFHHAVHGLLTGERDGYYEDFGRPDQLVACLTGGYAFTGQFSAFRSRRHGAPAADRPREQFMVFTKTHDHIGNRMNGERLPSLVSFEAQKLHAAVTLLAPFPVLMFMGDEYAEEAPFQYFVHHSDPSLIEAVRRGRGAEFSSFRWQGEPPDPQSEETFLRSKLGWERRRTGCHAAMLRLFETLLRLRTDHPALGPRNPGLEAGVLGEAPIVWMRRRDGREDLWALFSFAGAQHRTSAHVPAGEWEILLDTSAAGWDGPGSTLPPLIRSGAALTIPAQAAVLCRRRIP